MEIHYASKICVIMIKIIIQKMYKVEHSKKLIEILDNEHIQ